MSHVSLVPKGVSQVHACESPIEVVETLVPVEGFNNRHLAARLCSDRKALGSGLGLALSRLTASDSSHYSAWSAGNLMTIAQSTLWWQLPMDVECCVNGQDNSQSTPRSL
jgi:hypothetical protein